MAVFEDMLRGAVEEYLAALTPDACHPFLANAPRRFGLSAWSIVLEGQGYQVPHIHPAAWLSSVYYVRVPDIVDAPGRGHAGWMEFVRPAADFQCTVEPELRLFQPREGLLMLFPSNFYHRTVPFESPQTRISVSTDVLREA